MSETSSHSGSMASCSACDSPSVSSTRTLTLSLSCVARDTDPTSRLLVRLFASNPHSVSKLPIADFQLLLSDDDASLFSPGSDYLVTVTPVANRTLLDTGSL